jgi:RNA polymerase sigma factor (sigma-70 family)
VSDLLEHLCRVVLRREGPDVSDGQLLESFLTRRDEGAFEALVRRHGPMVWGVCRRVLRTLHDTEDAFQATFLVLARKGASIHPRDAVGNFLYGVAYRTALRARERNVRRQEKEGRVVDRSPSAADESWLELLPYLDRELNCLPDKYRLPVVLCDLEGRSRKEVAVQLRIPEGTVSSRLATARKRLAGRLRSHGLTLAGGAVAALLTQNAASASVPPALVTPTVKAAVLVASGRATAGIVSTSVVKLSEGVIKAMLLTKLRTALVAFVAVTILAGGASLPVYRIWAAQQSDPGARASSEPPAAAALPSPLPAPVADPQSAEMPEEVAPKPADAPKDADPKIIRGSGKLDTREMKVDGFKSLDLGNTFQVTITQGERFRTSVTADDNLFDYIKVVREDAELRVFLDMKNRSVQDATLKATIIMPSLEGLNVSGASSVVIKGFKQSGTFRGKVGGASRLRGDIQADTLNLEVAGASSADLEGSAKKATLSATGASSLRLTDLRIGTASVQLSGASRAMIRVKDKLDYSLSGACRLDYRGDPTVGERSMSGVSSVRHK